MDYLSQVQKGIDYIEANLGFDISLQQVAQEAGISQWHFQRMFKALTNETLKTYIRSRRLANAFEQLVLGQQKIIDIAVSAGFESQESFTRAFKKAFDMTPNEARKIGDNSLFLKKVEFNEQYLRHINQNVSLQPEIYTQRKMHLVGMKTFFYGADSEKNNMADKLPLLWNQFLPKRSEIEGRIEGVAYGAIQQVKGEGDLLEYYAACEVSHVGALPKGMDHIEIAASRYAKFTHSGLIKNIDDTVNYIYSSWLLGSEKRHTYACDLEIYGDQYRPDSDESLIHYAIPIE